MYDYVVSNIGFTWNGVFLQQGSILDGDDARALELPENSALLARCVRVDASLFSDLFS